MSADVRDLTAALGTPPASLSALTADQASALAALITQARAARRAALQAAIDAALDHVPRALRGALRKVLFA